MRRGLSHLLVFVLGGLTAAGLIAAGDLLQSKKLPRLAAGLPETAELREAAWAERLATAFPDGTREAMVISMLSEQGFRLHIRDGQLWADFDRSMPVCSESLIAKWSKDEPDAIRAMTGTVHLSCL